ncbi:MAG: monovalent cation/H+ antiporter subunit D family protein [Desulfobacula sp.]|nr:monovalent cation/H+ antiporter subunit D family protein [Desulfobacula sp.]
MDISNTPGLIFITTAIPMVTALLIMFFGKRPNIRESWAVIGAALTFLSVLNFLPQILAGGNPEHTFFTILPGVCIKFRLDGMGLLFAGTSSFLWILAAFYCVGYMRGLDEHAQTRFYVCYAISVGGAMGAAFAGNLFTLYLFYEIVSIATYPLVMHHQDKEGYEGGQKYIVYLFFTSKAFLLTGMILLYMQCGTLDFSASGVMDGIFPHGASKPLVIVIYLMFLFGFAKSGIMPLHNWLPSAMVAPTPVSALLHAVVVVKVGVFSTVRVMLSIFGTDLLTSTGLGIFTAYFVSFTIITASVIALTKTNLKARLAYSTVSQLSYIILGAALVTPMGVTGGLIHITNHAFAKITLFFCAGAIFVASGKKEITQMGGLAKRMPLTMAAFSLASLSMIGVPPVSGFVTKWYLAIGAMDIHNWIILTILLASSLLNAGYFLPVIIQAYYGKSPEEDKGETSNLEKRPLIMFMVIPLAITGLFSALFGLYPDLFLNIIGVVDTNFFANILESVTGS